MDLYHKVMSTAHTAGWRRTNGVAKGSGPSDRALAHRSTRRLLKEIDKEDLDNDCE